MNERLMSDIQALIARVDALEMHAAEQDHTIEDLNATVVAQWKEIESLKGHLARLGAQLQEIEGRVPSGPEPPPPHY
jgi:SlyX protein